MTKKRRYANYISEVKCSNCRKRDRIKIPYGTSIDLVPCPKCGKFTLHHPSYFRER